MRKFILRSFVFFSVLFLFFLIIILKPTPKSLEQSFVNSKSCKDSLLLNTPKNRIIFLGGSNVLFGLNSQVIKDSLNLNPINAAITANHGLKYTLKSNINKINKGDIVVLIPEYTHFFGNYANGDYEMLFCLLELSSYRDYNNLDLQQYEHLFTFLDGYFDFKLKTNSNIQFGYKKDGINKYGDYVAHWNKGNENKFIFSNTNQTINNSAIFVLSEFSKKLNEKGAKLYISFPPYQKKSYRNTLKEIKKTDSIYKALNLNVISKPIEYMVDDSLLYDTPYHLNKKGVDFRTNKLISDLKKVLK